MTCDNLPILEGECSRDKLVHVEDIVDTALEIIEENALHTDRVPPLLLARLPRGGKTTILKLIFEKLHLNKGYFPIIVSANGNFALREKEKPLDALIRLIAEQFVELPTNRNRNKLWCSEEDVLNYIQAVAGERKVILFIDELNQLGAPVDPLTSSFLKTWLDRKNYYVVFSSHVPLEVDVGASDHIDSPSSRAVKLISLPRTSDLETLSSIPGCGSLTPLQVSLYGGIPSLIYSQLTHGRPSIEERFAKKMISVHADFERDRELIIKSFLQECVTGEIRMKLPFDCFADYTGPYSRIWPLCYIKCILEYMEMREMISIEEAIRGHSSSAESGKDWEMITLANFYLRALDAMRNQRVLDCGPLSSHKNKVVGVEVRSIPPHVKTLAELKNYVNSLELKKGYIIILTPSYSKFPLIDGLIGYVMQTGRRKKVIWQAFQNKLSRKYPNSDPPSWINKCFLLRGNASVRSSGSRSLRNWTYSDKSELQAMLCYSLRLLYPAKWGEIPTTDDFDEC